jgi:hypothetical protein
MGGTTFGARRILNILNATSPIIVSIARGKYCACWFGKKQGISDMVLNDRYGFGGGSSRDRSWNPGRDTLAAMEKLLTVVSLTVTTFDLGEFGACVNVWLYSQ